MPAPDKNEVPLEVFNVPVFERECVQYSQRPEAKVFLVKSTKTPSKARIWYTREGYAELNKHYPGLLTFDEGGHHGGFTNGRQLINPSVPISTCVGSRRPPILYRVVHENQPYYGMKARGYCQVKITPANFQPLVEKHLNWKARNSSPFISTTNCHRKVRRMVRALQGHGETGLRIVEFRSSGRGWNHSEQRLFYVPQLGKCFDNLYYQITSHMAAEYLLENEIPLESILRIIRVSDSPYAPKAPRLKRKECVAPEKKERESRKRTKEFRREI